VRTATQPRCFKAGVPSHVCMVSLGDFGTHADERAAHRSLLKALDDALTPFLTPRAAAGSLLVFCATYVFIFAFGTFYIYRLLKGGPAEDLLHTPPAALPNRPLSVAADLPSSVK